MPPPVTSWLSEFIEEEVNKEDKVMADLLEVFSCHKMYTQ